MKNKSEIGRIGEDAAAQFLVKNNYKILERNYWRPWGEIDIIAKDASGVLVFVEVKAMQQNNSAIAGLQSEDNFSKVKERKTKKAAEMFAGKHPELIDDEMGWRVDLVSVCLTLNKAIITHYENV